ncbi:hypothetical protein EAX01_24720, partial [Salmonella enterica]|nr:hypothetical protein [Salmonella enterica]
STTAIKNYPRKSLCLKNVERGNFPDEFQLQMHYQSLSQIRLQIDGVARVEPLIDTKKIMDRQ